MFFPRTEPIRLDRTSLEGLRQSLNTPVISTDELPVGPARAAIASHVEPDGRPNVSIGICSVKTGAAVLYSFEGDLREYTSVTVAIDAALSFAEGMGFLFDEEEIDGGDPDSVDRALDLWQELLVNLDLASPEVVAPNLGEPGEELLLEEMAAEVLPAEDDDVVIDGDAGSGEGLEAPIAEAEALEGPPDGAPPASPGPPDYVPQFEGDLGLDTPVEFEGGLDASAFDSQPSYLGADELPIGELDLGAPVPTPGLAAQPEPVPDPRSQPALEPAAPLADPVDEEVLAGGFDPGEGLSLEDDVDPGEELSLEDDVDAGEELSLEDDVDAGEELPLEDDVDSGEELSLEDDVDPVQELSLEDGVDPGEELPLEDAVDSGEALSLEDAADPDEELGLEPGFDEGEELALEDAVDPGRDVAGDPRSPRDRTDPQPQASPRLTKFRRPDDEAPPPPVAAPKRQAALGRVRLVKRGLANEATDRPSPALRLFGAF